MDTSKELYTIERDALVRTLSTVEKRDKMAVVIKGRNLVDFSSNDYLGLSDHESVISASIEAARAWGVGSRAARLMSGDLVLHQELERYIADFKGTKNALLFGSGYLANVGIISAICGRGDYIFADRYVHASIIDGIRLSGARFFRFAHNDLNHLEDLLKKYRAKKGKKLIVAESLYSMDGDIAPIKGLIQLKERYGTVLMIDEAHAVGCYGRRGEGLVTRSLARSVDVMVGTFGKALGGYGAFAAVSSKIRDYLINRARSFIFSTALPPSVVGGNIESIKVVQRDSYRRKILFQRASSLRKALMERLDIDMTSRSYIVPVYLGDSSLALKVAKVLSEKGFYVRAIRPPTVPRGTARIRLSVTSHHSAEDISRLVEAFCSVL